MPKIRQKTKVARKVLLYPQLYSNVSVSLQRCDLLVKKIPGEEISGSGKEKLFANEQVFCDPLEVSIPNANVHQKDFYDSAAAVSFGDVSAECEAQKSEVHFHEAAKSKENNFELAALESAEEIENEQHEAALVDSRHEYGLETKAQSPSSKRKEIFQDYDRPAKKPKIIEEVIVYHPQHSTQPSKEDTCARRPKVIASFPIDKSAVIIHDDAEKFLAATELSKRERREAEVKQITQKTDLLFKSAYGSDCDDDSENEGSEWDEESIIESSDTDSDSDCDDICNGKELESLSDTRTSEIEIARCDNSIHLPDISGLNADASFVQRASTCIASSSLLENSSNLKEADQEIPKFQNNFETLGNVHVAVATKPKSKSQVISGQENPEGPPKKKNPRKRKWHMCLICNVDQSHLKRHMKLVHGEVPMIKRMLQESETDKNSRRPMKTLLHAGDKLLNDAYISGQVDKFKVKDNTEKSTFRTARKPYLKSTVLADYVNCPDCHASFKGKDFRAHFRRCTQLSAPNLRTIVQLGRRTFYHCHPEASEQLRLRILSSMRNDKVTRAIRYDRLIMRYGSDLVLRLRDKKDNKNIKTQLRRLGRLKLLLKVPHLADALHTDYSEKVVDMIEKMAVDPDDPERLLYPTVAQNVAGLVKAIAGTYKYLCVKDHDKELKVVAEEFLYNFSIDYYNRLSRHAGREQRENKRHQSNEMPSQAAIQQLNSFLRQLREKNYNILQKGFDKTAYLELLEATLTSLQVYNRRRPGDVERITLKDYSFLKEINSTTSRAFASLSPKLQDIAREYTLLYTTGKLGKDIKLLVSPNIRLCIEMLRLHRNQLDISPNNVYLFALERTTEQKNEEVLRKLRVDRRKREAMNHPSAYSLLRKFARLSGAERPELLRCNLLRKQMATECQNLNLDDAGLNDLANFMSHDVRIHKSVYRKDIIEREIPILLNFIHTANGVEDDVSLPNEHNTDADYSSSLNSTAASDHTDLRDKTFAQEDHENNNCLETSAISTKKTQRKKYNVPATKSCQNSSNKTKIRRVKYTMEEIKIANDVFRQFLHGNTSSLTTVSINKMLSEHSTSFMNRNADAVRTWLHGIRKENLKKQSNQQS